jgi:hypothetical protein
VMMLLNAESDMGKFYKVDIDEVVEAETAAELLDYLWRTAMAPSPTKVAYRLRAAMWARELTGKPIRTYSDDVFLADMIACGMWQEVAGPTKH